MRIQLSILCLLLIFLTGCEDTDLRLVAGAGVDAVTALTLSDETVRELAGRAIAQADSRHAVAPEHNAYARRLRRLVAEGPEAGLQLNCRIYLDDTVNAFAMADGSIRIYSGLMDMLDDGELRFVIGHEMGHIVKNHVRHKLQLAYAASAARKGLAAAGGSLGDLAASLPGGFVEALINSRFSRLEEKSADDFGLQLLVREGDDPAGAVSALRKLATLGTHHTFLSSHPEPGERADRLELQIQGKDIPLEEKQGQLISRVRTLLSDLFSAAAAVLRALLNLFKDAMGTG
ncbi:MAG: M48 family metalloprotease [Desulfobulbaceae bacterium]|jgi:putative metalloprotease|nr:M48 family metalloprotease [Desulfobulbaceae bacterium]